jgi:hypothetical protein
MRDTRHGGNRQLRPALLLTAGLLIVAAALVAAVYFWSPQANLRVTTGPPGSTAYRFITAFASVTEANHPRIHIKLVHVADLAASAKAIEDRATDLGIVRSDAVIPTNGATIAILRRDVVAFVVAANPRSTRSRPSPAGPSASRKDPCKLTTNRPSTRF